MPTAPTELNVELGLTTCGNLRVGEPSRCGIPYRISIIFDLDRVFSSGQCGQICCRIKGIRIVLSLAPSGRKKLRFYYRICF